MRSVSQHKHTTLQRNACGLCCSCARAGVQIHTPDSSRYWMAGSYEERHAAGLEPQNIDKEFLRLWFRDHCDPYNDEVTAPAHVACHRGAG